MTQGNYRNQDCQVLWLRAYLDPIFKGSLFLFVLSLCCDLYTRVEAQTTASNLGSTTPVYDFNAKFGKLNSLASTSVSWGIQALQVSFWIALVFN